MKPAELMAWLRRREADKYRHRSGLTRRESHRNGFALDSAQKGAPRATARWLTLTDKVRTRGGKKSRRRTCRVWT